MLELIGAAQSRYMLTRPRSEGMSVYFTWNRLIDNDNSYYIYNRLFELSPLRIVEHYIQKLGVLWKKSAKSVINSDKAVT